MSASRLLMGVVLFIVATDACAGVIRGEIRTAKSALSAGTAESAASTLGDAVIWVDSLPPAALRRLSGRYRDVRIAQRANRFDPRVTALAAGTTVRFVNQDQIYHNVFSISPAKQFDLGKYPPGASRRVVFDRPGTVNLFCELHPDVAAYVVVVPHRAFARPNRKGQFALPSLPPGRYRVRVWHPLLGETVQPVDVPRYGDVRITIGL